MVENATQPETENQREMREQREAQAALREFETEKLLPLSVLGANYANRDEGGYDDLVVVVCPRDAGSLRMTFAISHWDNKKKRWGEEVYVEHLRPDVISRLCLNATNGGVPDEELEKEFELHNFEEAYQYLVRFLLEHESGVRQQVDHVFELLKKQT